MHDADCTGAPLSWLVLEQYHLGELKPSRRDQVEGHLRDCGPCREAIETIVQDPMVLPPLPSADVRERLFDVNLLPFRFGFAAVMAGFLILLAIRLWPGSLSSPSWPPAVMGYKGGELAVFLVRERNGDIRHAPTGYLDGDRFRLHVTCPPGDRPLDVVVYQGDGAYFPLNVAEISCTNRAAIPGAFQLSGLETVHVCVMVDHIPPRETVAAGPSMLPDAAVCASLKPLK